MSGCAKRFPRLVDRAFVRGLSAKNRAALRNHLGSCSSCRERWGQLASIDRRLGGPALTLEMIDEIGDAVVSPPTRKRRVVAWATAGSVAATAAILLLLLRSGHETERSTFTARGTSTGGRTPGIRLFCIAGDRALAAAAMSSNGPPPELRCTMDSDLQLAYSTPDREGLTMVAFGRIQNSTLSYAPPAGDGDAVMLRADRIDEVVEWSTRLAVNHRPGRYAVIARFFDHSVSVADAIAGRVAPVAELQARLEVLPQGAVVDAP